MFFFFLKIPTYVMKLDAKHALLKSLPQVWNPSGVLSLLYTGNKLALIMSALIHFLLLHWGSVNNKNYLPVTLGARLKGQMDKIQ